MNNTWPIKKSHHKKKKENIELRTQAQQTNRITTYEIESLKFWSKSSQMDIVAFLFVIFSEMELFFIISFALFHIYGGDIYAQSLILIVLESVLGVNPGVDSQYPLRTRI